MRALVLSGGAAHGAFQAGAIQALYEMGWVPDVVCGASVGAINAACVVSGKTPEHLCSLWRDVESSDVYRWRPPVDWLAFWKWRYVLDTKPLRKLVDRHVDFEELYHANQLALCFSVDVKTGALRAYTNRLTDFPTKFRRRYQPQLFDSEALMSSTAIPLVFPWSGEEWDGALLQYAPMRPVVALGATEIVLVSLEVDQPDLRLPTGLLQTALQVMNISSMSALHADIKMILDRNTQEGYRNIDLHVISPTRSLGYSKLNFSSPEKESAIGHGRNRAYQTMRDYV